MSRIFWDDFEDGPLPDAVYLPLQLRCIRCWKPVGKDAVVMHSETDTCHFLGYHCEECRKDAER